MLAVRAHRVFILSPHLKRVTAVNTKRHNELTLTCKSLVTKEKVVFGHTPFAPYFSVFALADLARVVAPIVRP